MGIRGPATGPRLRFAGGCPLRSIPAQGSVSGRVSPTITVGTPVPASHCLARPEGTGGRGGKGAGDLQLINDPRGARQEVPPIIDSVLRAGEGKILRKLKRIADQVNSIEDDFVKMSDAELRGMTDELRERLADGESLDDLLPEAFATVREAAKRTLGQRHFDVQLMGGAAMHMGNIAEMKTGEGKTLTCVLPAYLNALTGDGVHVVTVNDYLAKRDAEWMGRVHRFLGLDVGVILA